jgi:hypothetical protein
MQYVRSAVKWITIKWDMPVLDWGTDFIFGSDFCSLNVDITLKWEILIQGKGYTIYMRLLPWPQKMNAKCGETLKWTNLQSIFYCTSSYCPLQIALLTFTKPFCFHPHACELQSNLQKKKKSIGNCETTAICWSWMGTTRRRQQHVTITLTL